MSPRIGPGWRGGNRFFKGTSPERMALAALLGIETIRPCWVGELTLFNQNLSVLSVFFDPSEALDGSVKNFDMPPAELPLTSLET